jgi:hypothetical protein
MMMMMMMVVVVVIIMVVVVDMEVAATNILTKFWRTTEKV